tara:strand:- start:651 stop:2741 length:2091 start_codon:yes stop_codon:yes gene_type:complete
MSKKNKIFNSGYILFVSMALTLGSTLIIASFMASLPSETLRVNQRIAKTKALYNAETGIAQKAYPFLIRSDFTADTTLTGELIQDFSSNYNHGVDMGLYLNPKLSFSDSGQREAVVEGVSFIINANGTLDSVKQTVSISARPETLAKYMYLTDSEKAGGAPFSWGPPGFNINERRDVYFGVDDIMDGLVQSNSDISLSNSTTCANFSAATLYITNDTEINLGNCGSFQSLFGFGNDIDTVSSPPVKLPPTGYLTLKNNATIVYDSGRKIGNGSLKDTLIMTDIEFFETGRVRVKQWWYLMPPHLKAGISELDLLFSAPEHLDGVVADANNNLFYNNDGDNNPFDNPLDCSDTNDLRTCEPYIDSLYFFHGVGYDLDGTLNNMPGEWYNNNPDLETYISETIRGPYGINQHFDFQPLNSNGIPSSTSLLREDEYLISSPTVFYIKDGPVRVSGFYKGQFTVVTDEHTKYRRHAWNSVFSVKQDTVWNNIWIIDDLVNVDAINSGFGGNPNHLTGNLSDFQPSDDCQGGSNNAMGLVSGANVIIANTPENGARGCSSGCNISINAAILALNESFVVHYGQNTTNQTASNVQVPGRFITGNTHNPPFGDGRGVERFGIQNNDKRQEIYLWGSVVQKHRGYMLRNPNSPYGNFGYEIGMDKNYHYDRNLFCTSPPFFPAIEYDDGTGEIGVSLTSFRKIN